MKRILLSSTFAILCLGCEQHPQQPLGEDTDTEIVQPDADNDTILDAHELWDDPDQDGRPNAEDRDSDGDVIRDKIEAGDLDILTLPTDSDGDGIPDFLDLDSDNNCIPDQQESLKDNGGAVDSDGDGLRDFIDPDNDDDGILDVDEIVDIAGCNPADTDGDGTPDYMDLDSDGDGIGDIWEAGTSTFNSEPVDSDGDGIPDFQDTDSDGDGIADGDESGTSSIADEPNDSDGDGLYDFQDTDSDGDGLSDQDELNIFGTDPYDFDTDGDGNSDGAEILADTNPLDPDSFIDGIYIEVGERTEVEELFTFELRIERGDIAFLLDTTGSMGSTINAMGTQFSSIVTELESTFEDAAYGFATYDDYAYGSMGSSTVDKPFELQIGVTTDLTRVQAELSAIPRGAGADGPESTVEALFQAATGNGYDQNCNGNYDTNTDVLPFRASSSDPFGGTDGESYDPSLDDVGLRGGYGFRNYSLPVIIYATDNLLRDAHSSVSTLATTPGGCPFDAGHNDVVSALSDIGGYLIGVDVGRSTYADPFPQMEELAEWTNSKADMDGGGVADDLLVYELDQSGAGFDEDFTEYVTTAVDQLVNSITFTEVSLEVEGDAYGFVTNIAPEGYTDIDPDLSQNLEFAITFRGTVAGTVEDQLFLLTLNILGDGTTLLDKKDILILVPGTSY